jgi:maltose alpha-D-glucosyltransferase/alpha-amylase
MLFAFWLNASLWLALARKSAEPLVEALSSIPRLPAMAQWATFLRNHDELDLSRLTQEQRSDVMAAFGPKPTMQLFGRGIRRRVAPMLGGDRRRIQLAYSLAFTMPGTPVMRYGDEIGMGEDLSLPAREAIRTPMQWDDTTNAGFSTAARDRLVLPVVNRGRFRYTQVNVRGQRRDGDSLINWFQALIGALRECPEIGVGTPATVDIPAPASVLAHRFDAPEGSILLLHNLADRPVRVDLSSVAGIRSAHQMFGDDRYATLRESGPVSPLNGYGYRWLRLRRSNADIPL